MRKKHEQIMSGEILVIGKDKLELELEYGEPDAVIVEFNKHYHPHHTPCDPHHDKLKWEIHRRHHGFVLIIEWHVNSAREIIWAVEF